MFAILLFYTGKLTRMIQTVSKHIYRLSLIASISLVLITIIGAIVFNVVRGQIDYLEWWLDTGFYGALIIGIVDIVFYTIMIRNSA